MVLRIRATHLLLAGGLVLAGSPAFAQEGVLFQNLMKGVFGGGSENDIDYRQRPPLVVPPNSTLPRPQDSASSRTAAWPNDPDVVRRREENAATRVPTFNPNYRNNPMLSQEELRKGRIARGEQAPVVAEDHNNYNNQIQPIRVGREVAARRNQTDEDTLQYGTEPPRRLLTEPPTGYRRPASSAALGPGARGPVEDKQAVGQREFLRGVTPTQ